jgi:hypothetical protein
MYVGVSKTFNFMLWCFTAFIELIFVLSLKRKRRMSLLESFASWCCRTFLAEIIKGNKTCERKKFRYALIYLDCWNIWKNMNMPDIFAQNYLERFSLLDSALFWLRSVSLTAWSCLDCLELSGLPGVVLTAWSCLDCLALSVLLGVTWTAWNCYSLELPGLLGIVTAWNCLYSLELSGLIAWRCLLFLELPVLLYVSCTAWSYL